MENLVTATAKTGVYVGKVIDGGVQEYLGIRYAKPAHRWKRAQPLEPSSEKLLALNDNPACYQAVPVEEYPNGKPPMSEDCLYLNVWTSDTKGKKPVYIFIHGGSYITGSCRTDCYGGVYCGDKFVAHYPDVVYVNIEYRIGPVGSMDLSRFEGSEDYAGSVNLQMRDQAMAIKWVYENIEAFGGDPEQITIGGQSAGSYSVYLLMGMPEIRNMIKGVIAESTAPSDEVLRADAVSVKHGFDTFYELSGCKTLKDVLEMPIQDIIKYGFEAKMAPGNMALYGPVCDDTDFTSKLEDEWKSGACKHIALMSGTVSGEFAPNVMNMSPDEIESSLKEMFPNLTDADITAYKANDPERDPHETMEDMFNDFLIRAAQAKASEEVVKGGSNVWVYYMDVKPEGGKLRAQHCFEIPYIADKLDCGLYLDLSSGETLLGNNPDPEYGRKLREVWHNFIVRHDPNGDGLGVEWPTYAKDRCTMYMGNEWRTSGEVRPEDLDIARKYN